jgi:predicted DsbA family dithiol-disulfide isomerase
MLEGTRCICGAPAPNTESATGQTTLTALWHEVGLPETEFARHEDPALLQETIEEQNEAVETGVTGVPAVRMEGNAAIIVGAQPIELYRRWITRALAERNSET